MVNLPIKFILLVTTSLLFSCSSTPDEIEILDRSVMSYERALRWGEFSRAKSFHKKAPTLSDLERRRLKIYRVTNYETLQHNTIDLQNANIFVEIKYYKNNQASVKTITVKQRWKRDKDGKIWYLDSPFPNFR